MLARPLRGDQARLPELELLPFSLFLICAALLMAQSNYGYLTYTVLLKRI